MLFVLMPEDTVNLIHENRVLKKRREMPIQHWQQQSTVLLLQVSFICRFGRWILSFACHQRRGRFFVCLFTCIERNDDSCWFASCLQRQHEELTQHSVYYRAMGYHGRRNLQSTQLSRFSVLKLRACQNMTMHALPTARYFDLFLPSR